MSFNFLSYLSENKGLLLALFTLLSKLLTVMIGTKAFGIDYNIDRSRAHLSKIRNTHPQMNDIKCSAPNVFVEIADEICTTSKNFVYG